MRLLILIIFFVPSIFTGVSQDAYRENLWCSFVIRKSIREDLKFTADVGYRSCDQFVRTNRTALGRLVIEKTILDSHSVGFGFAMFGHFKEDWSIEYRPFLQYGYQKSISNIHFGIRFRNEFRFQRNWSDLKNRSRLQLSLRYNGIKDVFQPGFSAEGFLTAGEQLFLEQRYTISVYSKITKSLGSQIFYTLQRQTGVNVNQNILGVQLQIDIK